MELLGATSAFVLVMVVSVNPAEVDLALVVVMDVLNLPMGTVNRTIVPYQPV